jgi:SAM-dependent methyltransferase
MSALGRTAKAFGARLVFGEHAELETARTLDLDRVGLAAPDRVDYIPSGWSWVLRALRGRSVGPDDVFVDFGSGKGRVVYLVARYYRFGRVVGVELSDHLTRVAERNLERARPRLRCQDVRLVSCDATEFEIPDDMTVAYFYNPFTGETFRRVIDNIVASLDRRPRRLSLVYANPDVSFAAPAACERYVLETGRFTLVRSLSGLRSRGRVSVYESS